ncbi:acyltransferase [Thalassomonas viridans]|uniref:Acyltransferase n=1 Tax=Thalassomonas viridans TaxID=137584 RepID=A0AAF0C7M0_9GAMM|nr:acyltransferase [Thalassomonas viridans]WDE02999.1 acyltransferase [Thalassomonas viridans]
MNILSLQAGKQWLKHNKHPGVQALCRFIKKIRIAEMPLPRFPCQLLYFLHQTATNGIAFLLRVFYWTPLFKSQLSRYGKSLYLYGGLPYLSGPLQISLGHDCRISAQTTFSGRTSQSTGQTRTPNLFIGNNCDIGWMTTIAVGRQVIIGNNVRIAGRTFLAGYPGHPVNAALRAQGAPDTDDQVRDIVLEDDVWLATGVSVMAGVRIGKGSIIAAGSVVTRDIPAGVLAAGVPAKVVKPLN